MEFPPKRSHCLHVSLASLNNDDAHGSTDHNQEPDVLEQWQETVAEDAEDDAEPADAEVCHVDVPLLDDIFRVEDLSNMAFLQASSYPIEPPLCKP